MSSSARANTDERAQRETFADGVRACLPIVLGYLAIGFAFGVVARANGLSVAEIGLMSLILYAGSAQFVATGLLAGGAADVAIVVTVFLVNLRHLLFSAVLAPRARRLPSWQNVLVGAELTDETFAMASAHLGPAGELSASWMFGLNVTAQATWVAASVAGGLVGRAVGNTTALGLDFALAAMFAALLVLQIAQRPRTVVAVGVAVLGATIALAGSVLVPGNWAILLAAITAASVGVLVERWT